MYYFVLACVQGSSKYVVGICIGFYSGLGRDYIQYGLSILSTKRKYLLPAQITFFLDCSYIDKDYLIAFFDNVFAIQSFLDSCTTSWLFIKQTSTCLFPSLCLSAGNKGSGGEL